MRHLDEDGHIFGLEEIRDERDFQVPRGYGNDVHVDYETSLIITCKGRFVSAQCLASLLPCTQGTYSCRQDMKDLVTSHPAAGALFTTVLGELCDLRVPTFWQKMEKYAEGGGDSGLTRAALVGCWATKRGLSSATCLS